MNTTTTIEPQVASAVSERARWLEAIEALRTEHRQFETYEADADGRVDGRRVEKILEDLMTACGGNPFEWISARSLAPHAACDSSNRVPTD